MNYRDERDHNKNEMDSKQVYEDTDFIPTCNVVRIEWNKWDVDHHNRLDHCQDFVHWVDCKYLIFCYSVVINQFHAPRDYEWRNKSNPVKQNGPWGEHKVHVFGLAFLFISLLARLEFLGETDLFSLPEFAYLTVCYLVLESYVKVVWINFAWCPVANQIEKKSAQNDCRDLKQLKESPKLPPSSLLGKLFGFVSFIFCSWENNDHSVDCQVYLTDDEQNKVLRKIARPRVAMSFSQQMECCKSMIH